MATITYANKDKTLPTSDVRRLVRDVDMNEIKSVVNANYTAFLAAINSDPDFADTVATALATKANIASPTFTGTPAAPTPSANDNSTKLSTTAYADAKVANNLTASATVAPAINAVNTALALKTAFLSFAKRVALTGTQDGVNNTFGIPQPIVLDSEEFFRNGSLQVSPGDYTISGQTITTVVPPESWETLRTNYIRP